MTQGEMLATILVALAVAVFVFFVVSRPFSSRHAGRGDRAQSTSLGLFLGVLCATVVLIVPALFASQQRNPVSTFFMTALRMLKVFSLDEDYSDYMVVASDSAIHTVYFCLVTAAYVALPVLAALNIFELVVRNLDNCSEWITCHRSTRGKDVVLFSGPSQLAFTMAGQALNDLSKRCYVVFASMSREKRDEWRDEIENLDTRRVRCLEAGYGTLARRICSANRFGTLTCLAVSMDTKENVISTCEAVEWLKGEQAESGEERCTSLLGEETEKDAAKRGADGRSSRESEKRQRAFDVRLYVVYDNPVDEYLLDATNQITGSGASLSPRLQLGKIRLEPMAALQLLEKVPLFAVLEQALAPRSSLRPIRRERLQVLILGSGAYAEEALKASLWQGQMENVELDVHVAGNHSRDLEERLLAQCPGLQGEGRFSLHFHTMSLNSTELTSFVQETLTSDKMYVIVAIENDEQSYELAVAMRRLLFDKYAGYRVDVSTNPVIACLVRDRRVSSRISADFDLGRDHFAIHPFGCTSDLLTFEKVVDSPLEKASSWANDIYDWFYDDISNISLDSERVDITAVREVMLQLIKEGFHPTHKTERLGWPVGTLPQIQYWSNVSSAAHARYKSWALGVDDASSFTSFGEDVQSALTDSVIDSLGKNEHDRWTVFYETQGFTFLDDDEQVAYSRTLAGDNGRQKVEALHKHAFMCPYDEVWAHYVHAKGGFRYLEPGRTLDGHVELELVPDSPSKATMQEPISVQLLDEDYRVLRELDLGSDGLRINDLEDGDYIIHPVRAIAGRQCAADTRFTISNGHLGKSVSDSEGSADKSTPRIEVALVGGRLVNPVAYDMAFAIAAPYLVNKLGW